MKIFSDSFQNGEIKKEYGVLCDKADIIDGVPQRAIHVRWEDIPKGTKSIAIIFVDYDNIEDEGVLWYHWIVADIEPSMGEIKENMSRKGENFIEGCNSWVLPYGPYKDIPDLTKIGYGGPAPIRTHEYELKVLAIDKVLGLKKGFYFNQLRKEIQGHVIEEVKIVAKYFPY
ncbi:MAG: YbhB/YbcL family Raf kinase inhibitor-like protein [Anaerovoracaceae bacterium]